VNNPLTDDWSFFGRPLADVDTKLTEISDDLVVQLVGATFARMPLGIDELRDIRIVAFLLDVSTRTPDKQLVVQSSQLSRTVVVDDRFRSITGLSAGRVQRSLSRLVEARVLEQVADDPPGWFRLAPKAMLPVRVGQYVSWSAVTAKIAGRVPAILLLRVMLDLITVPWDWTRLTYDQLAARASYSLGMAQRGVAQLLELGVLERASHSGRGHEYRLSSWTLGHGPIPETVVAPDGQVPEAGVPEYSEVSKPVQKQAARNTRVTSIMAVEIGGLVLRVPVGTEIHMTVGLDGELQYEIGSDLKLKRGP
jgi:hypothetical protein